jgi:hypothetical protein
MARLSRVSWVAAPVAFFITYRLALHLYRLPHRRALVEKHGTAAFYDGMLFGLASEVTMWYAITLVLLVLILPQITFVRALLVGGTTALLMLAILFPMLTKARVAAHHARADQLGPAGLLLLTRVPRDSLDAHEGDQNREHAEDLGHRECADAAA